MRAIWFEKGQASLMERPRPVPGPGQALLRVLLAGVCQTDLELLAGYYGFAGVPGHEFVGLVEEAPGRPELIGRRVVADINLGCGRCEFCLAGDPRHCLDRRVIGIKHWDGAFADYLLAPQANLRPVPDQVSDRQAVFAEPLAAALQVGQQVHLTAGQRVLVLGDGKLGLLLGLSLRLACPGLMLLGRHPEKLGIAAAQGVAVQAVGERDAAGLARDLGSWDVVVEATGRPQGLELALALVKAKGVVVMKTTSHLPTTLDLAQVVVREVRLIGSRCGDLGLALHHLRHGWLDVAPLIAAEHPLADISRALAQAASPGALKVLLRPGG